MTPDPRGGRKEAEERYYRHPAQVVALTDVRATPTVAAMGFFDGVHLGHRSLLVEAVRTARQTGVRCAAVTFDRHPLETVCPDKRPPLLMTTRQRFAALAASGVDLVVSIRFTSEVAAIAPEDFVVKLLSAGIGVTDVVVGTNFRFGAGGRADVEAINAIGQQVGVCGRALPLAAIAGTTVSSTRIRALVHDGDVREARTLLGRPHTVSVCGAAPSPRGLGRSLVVDPNQALPPAGHYTGALRDSSGMRIGDSGLTLHVSDCGILRYSPCEIHTRPEAFFVEFWERLRDRA